jgi:hypothetical protein
MTPLQRTILADVLDDDYVFWELASWSPSSPPALGGVVDSRIVEQVQELVENGWAEVCESSDGSGDPCPVADLDAARAALSSSESWRMPGDGGGRYWLRGTPEGLKALRDELGKR